ncbi:MAG: glycosyltransferase family 4 protein [Lachnospiraceae bacterium]|nr:glycosyltransferase family 4 protein [Lachnospiraceae bacterium]
MDIVIISEFCEDFSETDNDRFLYLAKMITGIENATCNNNVEIITSSFRHTTKSQRRETVSKWPFNVTFVSEPGYPKNVCLKRFYSHYVWGRNVIKYLKNREAKPDVIYCAVPSLTGPNLVAKYCENEDIRFVIDVQDLWPEAFRMSLNVPIISDIVFSPFKALANGIYKRADAICAVSDTYCKRAVSVNKKNSDTTTVFLGTELAVFDKYAKEKPILEKKEDEIWLAYCGTLGSSYDITCVIDALSILNYPKVRFIIMGDGPKKAEFERYAAINDVKTVFVGRLKYDEMCSLLSACDIMVNPIAHNAAQSIINKHADYAASGKPVVSTQESREYRKLIKDYRMGFNCKNSDAGDLANKIKTLADNPKLRTRMGDNARKCAEACFDRKNTYKSLLNVIGVQ